MRRYLVSVLAALAALCWATLAPARPFILSDLLHEESVGRAAFDPTGRWLVVERRDPYDTLGRYDYYLQTSTALTRLLALDRHGPGQLTPLIPGAAGRGVVIGAFSPSGEHLAVYRLQDANWTLGIVDLPSRKVRWLPITPERPAYGKALQWVSDSSLLLVARPDRVAPWLVREGQVAEVALPRYWALSRDGVGAQSVLGSGRYRSLRPRPAPRQLLRLDAVSGRSTVLATGELEDLEVAPDRTHVAVFEGGPDIQSQKDGPVQGAAGMSMHASRLSIVDLRTGVRATPCATCDALVHLLAWSPSGREVLAYVRDDGALWAEGRLVRIDAETGRLQPTSSRIRPVVALRPDIVRAGWMGEDPVVYATPEQGDRADWYRLGPEGPINLTSGFKTAPRVLEAVNANSITIISDDALWRVGPSGAAAQLTAGPVSTVPFPSNTVAVRTQVAVPAGSWVRFGRDITWVEGGQVGELLHLDGDAQRVIAGAPNAHAALLDHRDPSGQETLALATLAPKPRALAQLNSSFADVPAPRLVPISHPGPEGQPLTSWLFLPPVRSGQRAPLLIAAYAGARWPAAPFDSAGEVGFEISVRTLVGHGYAVLIPSLPVPKGDGDPVAGLARRIESIVDAVAARPELADAVDTQRLALWGFSYGGYTAQTVLTQSHRFRAAVSIAGLSDLVMKWESTPVVNRVAPEEGPSQNQSMGDTEIGQELMYRPPWADPGRYVRNSPVFSADRIETPLILFHGDQDAITLTQSEAMYSALYRQSKDAIFVIYWGEGHAITSPGNVRDLYTRAFAFLDANLWAPTVSAPP
jgi:dipeptidyl aminopeptidase/acylaminoacyl peptidase